jgi:hypothetical protein
MLLNMSLKRDVRGSLPAARNPGREFVNVAPLRPLHGVAAHELQPAGEIQ